ncbi:hypothetical protein O9929_19550 [Vibrio lentus]|nr:hypothetical protein [Vibrio lentus]
MVIHYQVRNGILQLLLAWRRRRGVRRASRQITETIQSRWLANARWRW